MRKAIVFLLAFLALPAFAGYAVRKVTPTVTTYTSCYYTVGMGIAVKLGTDGVVVTGINSTNSTWTATQYGGVITGDYIPCTGLPNGTNNPVYAADVVDPGITSSGVSSGGGTSGGSIDTAALSTAIASGVTTGINGTSTPEDRFADGLALGWAVVSLMVVGWGASMVRKQLR